MRILIVKLSSIGDVVHTLPALAAIRRAYPAAEVSWVAERPAAELLQDNPLLDRLIEVDTKALRRWPLSGETLTAPRRQLRRLRASAFDVALDFQGLLKSAAIALLSGAPRRYGFEGETLREPVSRYLLTGTVNVPPPAHVITENLTLAARALNIPVPGDPSRAEFPIGVSSEDEDAAERAAASAGGEFALLNLGGGWPTKLWEPERFGRLADELWERHNLRSLVTHGPHEVELAERVVRAGGAGGARAVDVSIKAFYALARRASLYVGGDTGPTHLAVAAGAPIVGLYGPTEWQRNGSPHPDDLCVERHDIECRTDCHRRACSRWVCMDIEVESVLAAVGERLRRAGAASEAAEARALA